MIQNKVPHHRKKCLKTFNKNGLKRSFFSHKLRTIFHLLCVWHCELFILFYSGAQPFHICWFSVCSIQMVCFLYICGSRSGLQLTFVRLLVTTALCHHCSVVLTALFTRSQLHLSINKKHEGSCYCFYYLFITALPDFSSHLTLSAFPLHCHLPTLFYKRAGDSFIFFFSVSPPLPPQKKGSPWEFFPSFHRIGVMKLLNSTGHSGWIVSLLPLYH